MDVEIAVENTGEFIPGLNMLVTGSGEDQEIDGGHHLLKRDAMAKEEEEKNEKNDSGHLVTSRTNNQQPPVHSARNSFDVDPRYGAQSPPDSPRQIFNDGEDDFIDKSGLLDNRYLPLWEIEAFEDTLSEWSSPDHSDELVYRTNTKSNGSLDPSHSMKTKLDIPILNWIWGSPKVNVGSQGAENKTFNWNRDFSLEMRWKGLKIFRVRPGLWFQPNWGTVKVLDTNTLQSPDDGTAKQTFSEFYNPSNGTLTQIYNTVLAGYAPAITIKSSKADMKDLKEELSINGGICIMGICFDTADTRGKNGVSMTTNDEEIRLAMDGVVVLGRGWSSYHH